ncbi:low-specificity L-threonine aldolase [Limibacillus halophilus]
MPGQSAYPAADRREPTPSGHNAPRSIDLRSDTVTQPSEGMRQAMLEAEVGDDVYGDDPTVSALEKEGAKLLGKEAGLFVPSGTQSNLTALLTHCGRGEEYLVGEAYHSFGYEAGGSMALGGICAHPLPTEPNGQVALARFEGAIRPDDSHFAITKLICLENTCGGRVLPLSYQADAIALARRHGLSIHLDGARLMNAAVKLGVAPDKVTEGFDSVSLCLSKGLGAPVGSLLVGESGFIRRARRWRKMLGGGMRQAGVLAACGLYALENNIARLAEDHANAKRLAEGLATLPGIAVDLESVETNMVFAKIDPARTDGLLPALAAQGIVISGPGPHLRLVTHLDITSDDVETVIEAAATHLAA